MKAVYKESSEFINPYRQNKRWFSKFLNKTNNLEMNSSKNNSQKYQVILDNVSKAQSIKFVQNSIENISLYKNNNNQDSDESFFLISNKRKNQQLQNPQLFQLVSKHIQTNEQKSKKISKPILKPISILLSEKIKTRSKSVQQLQKNPKITQFSRQTFYRNVSSTKRQYSSKKQKQDFLHSNSNLDINTRKQSICKKTRSHKDGRSFITYEIYMLKQRIGIDVQILAGALKQIKFRLIMNQSDTKTFMKLWKDKIDQFIDKCLILKQDGISLKVGVFNCDNQLKRKQSKIRQVHKAYMEHYESLLKRKNNKKIVKKINNLTFTQEYNQKQVNQVQQQIKDKTQTKDLIETNSVNYLDQFSSRKHNQQEKINQQNINKDQVVQVNQNANTDNKNNNEQDQQIKIQKEQQNNNNQQIQVQIQQNNSINIVKNQNQNVSLKIQE